MILELICFQYAKREGLLAEYFPGVRAYQNKQTNPKQPTPPQMKQNLKGSYKEWLDQEDV